MKKNVLLMVSIMLISSTTFAGLFSKHANQKEEQKIAKPEEQKVAQNEAHALRPLGFNEYKEACLDPARFHNQIAPTNIQISCHDEQLKWQTDTDNSLAVGNSRQMTVAIFSEKYSSHSESEFIESPNQMVSCPRFKQVVETVESIHSVNCEELIAFQGSAVEFCQSKINSLRAVNPESVKTISTGKIVDTCDNKGTEYLQH